MTWHLSNPMTEVVLIFHGSFLCIALRILKFLKLGLPKYGVSCWRKVHHVHLCPLRGKIAGRSLLQCLEHLLSLLLHWLGVCRAVSHISLLLSPAAAAMGFFATSQICYPRGAIADGLSLGQWQIQLGASWHWFYQPLGKLLEAYAEVTPVAPLLLPKPYHPIQNLFSNVK